MLLHDRKRDDKKLLNLLKKHCDAEEELLGLFFFGEKIEIEDLKEKILSLKQVRDETLYLFEKKSGEDEREKEKEKGDRQSLNISGSIVKEREFDSQTIESYNFAKNEISAIYQTISDNKTPVLNLHTIKDFMKNISPYFLSQFPIHEDVNIDGVITIISSRSEIKDQDNQLILRNGRKVTITSRNCDFTDFSYNELIEILRFFDTLVTDSSLDYLRTEIVKQINAISNVSLIKF